MRTVRVAVVDDSTFIRKALARMLGDHPQIRLVGSAGSGEELLTNLDRWRPDVVTLDLDMPGMGGLATLDRLMLRRPTPVIVLSTHSGEGAPQTIEALHRGATDFIDKQQYSLVDFESLRRVLLTRIFEVAQVDARSASSVVESRVAVMEESSIDAPSSDDLPTAFDIVVVGASTGGPPTLQRILEDLGTSFAVPVVVAQHMPLGFTEAFAERLNAYLPLQVREASAKERLLPDTVYIAPAGLHLRIRARDGSLHAELSLRPSGLSHMPSVDILFESAAKATGRRTIGVLLTGMGKDGAEGMAAIRARGGYTLTQDESSCVVYGMPRAAHSLDAVSEEVPLTSLGRRLGELLRDGDHPSGGRSDGPPLRPHRPTNPRRGRPAERRR